MDFQTARLWIRDPMMEDLEGVHGFLSDPEVMRWIHLGPEPYTMEQSATWIKTLQYYNQEVPRSSHNSILIERKSDQIIGWIGIGVPTKTGFGDLDFGYALKRDYWGKGYMTEALRGMLAFAFVEMGANVVFGECDAANIGSARVMEKAGMQRTHEYLESNHPGDEPVTMYRYTIIRDT